MLRSDRPGVSCNIKTITLDNESGIEVEGVQATCANCLHETASFGTSEVSIRRCLALMREECPLGDSNWYVDEGDFDYRTLK